MARTWQAHAKINLALHVTGRRADGYHLIESMAVFTRFGDRVETELADRDQFSVSGKYAPARRAVLLRSRAQVLVQNQIAVGYARGQVVEHE